MDNTTSIILITFSSIISAVLFCLCIRYHLIKMKEQYEKNRLQNLNLQFNKIFKNRIMPSSSDEEMKDGLSDVNIKSHETIGVENV